MNRFATWLSASAVLALVASPLAAQTDTTFTYQGELKESSNAANGMYNMDFSMFDALAGGSQIGSTVSVAGEDVVDGLFRVELDFGALDFAGSQYWLEIVIDGNTLSPRQSMTASPFSIQTRGIFVDENNNVGIGTAAPDYPLEVVSSGIRTIYARNTAISGTNFGMFGQSASTGGRAVYGLASASSGIAYGVFGESAATSGRGVAGFASALTGNTHGVWGRSDSSSGTGAYGAATAGSGVTYGVEGHSFSTSGTGVYGWTTANSGTTYGVWGESESTSGQGIHGLASATSGVTTGVFGGSASPDGRGVRGHASTTTGANFGVWGSSASTSGTAVYGRATAVSGVTTGVLGRSDSSSGFDFYANGAGTNYGAASSRRWKSDIRNIDDPLGKIARLRGVYYTWDKEHGGHHDLGMIAEEVGEVLPEIVNYEENGVDAIGLDYGMMTPLLVEGINALRAEKDTEIAELRERITELERLIMSSDSKEQTGIANRLIEESK